VVVVLGWEDAATRGWRGAEECAVKRGTPDHPKVVRFAAVLGVTRYAAVGLLELLWHLTARYTPCGDVGKWSDQEIAIALGWDGPPTALIHALVASGLLESHPVHRLIVHDWAEHADKAVKQLLARQGRSFVSTCGDMCGHVSTSAEISALPEPVASSQSQKPLILGVETPILTQLGFDRFWKPYPKKRHKPAAVRAWKGVDGARHLEAILVGVEAWKQSAQWQSGRIEDPATFLNQRQWEDPVPRGAHKSQAASGGALPPTTNYTQLRLQAEREAYRAKQQQK